MFARREQKARSDERHKLAPLTTGPFAVTEKDLKTRVIAQEDGTTGRMSSDSTVAAPAAANATSRPEKIGVSPLISHTAKAGNGVVTRMDPDGASVKQSESDE